MKALALHKGKPSIFRPSRVLGLLIGVEIIAFTGFVYWQRQLADMDSMKVGLPQWVILAGVLTAMLGWATTSLVTIKNSVKQHTINTLLQSRLSATYMTYADKLNLHFSEFSTDHGRDPSKWNGKDPIAGVDIPALRYVMNYFEFIAIGIRHGDLEEEMLRSSLGSILKNTVIFARSYIDSSMAGQPLAFCNLVWLNERWK